VLCGLIVGLALIVLTTPGVTAALFRATGAGENTGLSESFALELAEETRLYVTRRGAPELPVRVDGREGFTDRAVAHLDDVRGVISGARVATGVFAGAVAVWLALATVRRRLLAMQRALKAGAVITGGAVTLGFAGAATGFDRFFAAFHGLFFEGDTWLFAPGELLVQLFPERFWMAAGLIWGVLCLLGALVLYAVALAIARRAPRTDGS
jgi:integral membrane protein (TIGR01906 family)